MRRFACVLAGLVLLSCSDDKASGTGAGAGTGTATQSVGAEGATIAVAGATVTIPPGALAAPVNITITASSSGVPEGFEALSQVFHCEPSGTNFAQPVTMKMPFTDDGRAASMFWTAGADVSFNDVGGTPANGAMTATVSHFSGGFVGRKK